jgi:hypothetical protein
MGWGWFLGGCSIFSYFLSNKIGITQEYWFFFPQSRINSGVARQIGITEKENYIMENEFALLSQFLEEMNPEVVGHNNVPVSEEQLELINKFAAGGLNTKERETLLPTLIENEQALHDLVQAIKSRQK